MITFAQQNKIMKKFILLFSAITFFIACKNAPKGDAVETTEKQETVQAKGDNYILDSASVITWTGTKPTQHHTGTFKFKEGVLFAANNTLTGGSFIIDIASLTDTDINDGGDKAKLEGHLKSPDFFDATKYPTAKFEITSVEPFIADSTSGKTSVVENATNLIKGNLTIKDSTANISFPAKVTIDAQSASAFANFNIDRTRWGINYKGPGNPKDWIIKKEVNIQLSIRASKK